MGSRSKARTGGPPDWDEHLLEPAWQLRNRSPELALLLGTRLVAQLASSAGAPESLLAEASVAVASCRVGQGYEQVERGTRCIRDAERLGVDEVAHALRVELAGCARALNAIPEAAGLLHPTLGEPVPGSTAAAFAEAALCLARAGRRAELDTALAEADRLYAEVSDETTPAATARASLRAVVASQHRRSGAAADAVQVCREGLELVGQGQGADGGQAVARLTLELVLSLLDLGRTEEAVHEAATALDLPLRAPAAAPVSWLRYALATRVFQPDGRLERAKDLLRTASTDARRHRLPAVLSSVLSALTEVHELADESREAVGTLREAQAAAVDQRRVAATARRLIATAYPPAVDAVERLATRVTELAGRPARVERRAEQAGGQSDRHTPADIAEPGTAAVFGDPSTPAPEPPDPVDASWLPDELTALATVSEDGPVDETADRMTDFSAFGLPIRLESGSAAEGWHGRPSPGEEIALLDAAPDGLPERPSRRTRSEEPPIAEPTTPPHDVAAEFQQSISAFDSAWDALLDGTALSRPARRRPGRGHTEGQSTDDQPDGHAPDDHPPDDHPPDDHVPVRNEVVEAGEQPADGGSPRRGRAGISEFGLVAAEGSGGRRRAPEPDSELLDSEPPDSEPQAPAVPEHAGAAPDQPRAAEASVQDASGDATWETEHPGDRAWLESIGYWPARSGAADRGPERADRAIHETAAQVDSSVESGAADSTSLEYAYPENGVGNKEPTAPIPLRRSRRSRRGTTTNARDASELALGDLLTEAMLAFHTGATLDQEDTGGARPAPRARERAESRAESRDADPGHRREPTDGTQATARSTRRARRETAAAFDFMGATDHQPADTSARDTPTYADTETPEPTEGGRHGRSRTHRPLTEPDSVGYPVPDGDGSASRGAHAGGTRPGREWRLSDWSTYGS